MQWNTRPPAVRGFLASWRVPVVVVVVIIIGQNLTHSCNSTRARADDCVARSQTRQPGARCRFQGSR